MQNSSTNVQNGLSDGANTAEGNRDLAGHENLPIAAGIFMIIGEGNWTSYWSRLVAEGVPEVKNAPPFEAILRTGGSEGVEGYLK